MFPFLSLKLLLLFISFLLDLFRLFLHLLDLEFHRLYVLLCIPTLLIHHLSDLIPKFISFFFQLSCPFHSTLYHFSILLQFLLKLISLLIQELHFLRKSYHIRSLSLVVTKGLNLSFIVSSLFLQIPNLLLQLGCPSLLLIQLLHQFSNLTFIILFYLLFKWIQLSLVHVQLLHSVFYLFVSHL